MMKDEKKLKMTFCRECNPRAVSSSRFQLHGQQMIFCFLWQGHKDHSNATKEIASDGKQIWRRINALALCRKLIAILQGESAREPSSRNTGGKKTKIMGSFFAAASNLHTHLYTKHLSPTPTTSNDKHFTLSKFIQGTFPS